MNLNGHVMMFTAVWIENTLIKVYWNQQYMGVYALNYRLLLIMAKIEIKGIYSFNWGYMIYIAT